MNKQPQRIEETTRTTQGGYVFVYGDSRGICTHCLELGGFANPLYCHYNHATNFDYEGYFTESHVAHDPTLPGTHRESEWEERMYAEMAHAFSPTIVAKEREAWG